MAKPTFDELLERSSLGTPEVKAARASVSDEQVQRVLRRADELSAEKKGNNKMDVWTNDIDWFVAESEEHARKIQHEMGCEDQDEEWRKEPDDLVLSSHYIDGWYAGGEQRPYPKWVDDEAEARAEKFDAEVSDEEATYVVWAPCWMWAKYETGCFRSTEI